MRFRFGHCADTEQDARLGFADEYKGVPVEKVYTRAGRWFARGMVEVSLADLVRLSRETASPGRRADERDAALAARARTLRYVNAELSGMSLSKETSRVLREVERLLMAEDVPFQGET